MPLVKSVYQKKSYFSTKTYMLSELKRTASMSAKKYAKIGG